jgi:integrase
MTNRALSTQRAERIRKYVTNAKSVRTQKEYKRHWEDFAGYCQEHGYESLPASPAAVADFLTYVADAGAKVSTIHVKAAAISYMHDAAHLDNPMRTIEVKETLRGIRRTLGTAQKGKEPVTLEQLRTIVQSLPVDLRGTRDKAIVLIGWAGAFRRSELVALELFDIKFERDQATITVRRSKTDQEGRGMKKIIPMLKDKLICPVQALRDWLNEGDITSGAIFRPIDRWGHVANRALKPQEVARTVKRCAKLAELDPEQLSGHSLRAGYVTEAAGHDVPTWQIREQTGHKNDQVLQRYIRDQGRGAKRATKAAFGEL